jgi:hypothetical protein
LGFSIEEMTKMTTLRLLLPLLMAVATTLAAPALAAAVDMTLYETSEIIDLSTPIPTRSAPLLGAAVIDSDLCALAKVVLGGTHCTVTGIGTAIPTGATPPQLPLEDPFPIAVFATGTLSVVAEGTALGSFNTNPTDVAEILITTGAFQAPQIDALPLPAGTPKGLKKKLEALQATGLFVLLRIEGSITIDYDVNPTLCGAIGGCPDPVTKSFTGIFRLPFSVRGKDDVERPRRGRPAFYLSDTGKLLPVRQDERAVGYPAPRLEVTFTP